ncbi:MAG: carboxymuconolactone decarboxylase family protein [Deltaproteobacteria bacterium]|nr:carboxymuconolactone decarboxylase family protein [Deltaproteobacteria bacterium]
MPRVEPMKREQLAEFEPFFEMIEGNMGFVPNSMLTLGRRPELLRAFAGLTSQVVLEGAVSRQLKQLVAFVASNAAGCRYCQAHTSHSAHAIGISEEKIAAALEFETSDLFDDRERAALRVARDAAFVPNATTDAQFEDLHRYFDDDAIVEIVAVISMFGWLNRWNDTMATELEASPRAFAEKALGEQGWEVGRHAG